MVSGRERLGLSQRELAERLKGYGVNLQQSAIGKIEVGKREPKLDEVIAIARVLTIRLDAIATDPVGQYLDHTAQLARDMRQSRSGLKSILHQLDTIYALLNDERVFRSRQQFSGSRSHQDERLSAGVQPARIPELRTDDDIVKMDVYDRFQIEEFGGDDLTAIEDQYMIDTTGRFKKLLDTITASVVISADDYAAIIERHPFKGKQSREDDPY